MATAGMGNARCINANADVRVHYRPGSPSQVEARHVDLAFRTAMGLPGGLGGRTSSAYREMLGKATSAGRGRIDILVARGISHGAGHSFHDVDPLEMHIDAMPGREPEGPTWLRAATVLVFETNSLATAPEYQAIRRRVDAGGFELAPTLSDDDKAVQLDALKERYGDEIEAFVHHFGIPATNFAIEKETAEWSGTNRIETVLTELDPPGCSFPLTLPYSVHPTVEDCIRAQFHGGFTGHFGQYCQQYHAIRALTTAAP